MFFQMAEKPHTLLLEIQHRILGIEFKNVNLIFFENLMKIYFFVPFHWYIYTVTMRRRSVVPQIYDGV